MASTLRTQTQNPYFAGGASLLDISDLPSLIKPLYGFIGHKTLLLKLFLSSSMTGIILCYSCCSVENNQKFAGKIGCEFIAVNLDVVWPKITNWVKHSIIRMTKWHCFGSRIKILDRFTKYLEQKWKGQALLQQALHIEKVMHDGVLLFGYWWQSYLVLCGLVGAVLRGALATVVHSKYAVIATKFLSSLSFAFSDVVSVDWWPMALQSQAGGPFNFIQF